MASYGSHTSISLLDTFWSNMHNAGPALSSMISPWKHREHRNTTYSVSYCNVLPHLSIDVLMGTSTNEARQDEEHQKHQAQRNGRVMSGYSEMWNHTVLPANLSWMTWTWCFSFTCTWLVQWDVVPYEENKLFSHPFQRRHLWSWPAALPAPQCRCRVKAPFWIPMSCSLGEMNVANPMPETIPKITILWVGFQPSPNGRCMAWVSHIILFYPTLMGFHFRKLLPEGWISHIISHRWAHWIAKLRTGPLPQCHWQ
jgi:hypothetical protein